MSQCFTSWVGQIYEASRSDSLDVLNLRDVAELAWEDGQPAMRNLGSPPTLNEVKSPTNQEKCFASDNELFSWFNHNNQSSPVKMDAIVPNFIPTLVEENGCITVDREENITKRNDDVITVPDFCCTFANSLTPRAHTLNGGKRKSPSSRRRITRAAATHNQSERIRREKINQRIRTLHSLIPHSKKTDKVSILDKTIEYVKLLKGKVQMNEEVNMLRSVPKTNQQSLSMQMRSPVNSLSPASIALSPYLPAQMQTIPIHPNVLIHYPQN